MRNAARESKALRQAMSPVRTLRWLTLLGLGVALGMLALGAAMLLDARRDAWHQAEQASGNLVLALERDIARTIAVYDLSLMGAAEALQQPGIDGISPTLRHIAIFDRSATADYLGSLLVLNARGDIVADSTSPQPHAINLSDRDYFRVHQEHADAGLFVSLPFRSRLRGGDASVAISRRLSAPDGTFAGTVVGTLRLAYFRDLFARLEVGAGGSITVMRADGRIIARKPGRDDDALLDLSRSETAIRFMQDRSGQFTAASSVDGVARLFSYRGINDLPLLVNVAVSTDEVYRAWWRKALVIGSVLGVLSGAVIALCLLFRREVMRRMAAECALVASAERLQVMASTDGLTGLANRRQFETRLTDAWRRAARDRTSLALLMIDADCFKAYNDAYGHPAGDLALRGVAECIGHNIRAPGDLGARYGGEEFVVLLPGADAAGALATAERIHGAVRALGLPHAGGPAGRVSVSIGVAVARPRFGEADSLLVREADGALYEAKHAGRDRVAVAGLGGREALA